MPARQNSTNDQRINETYMIQSIVLIERNEMSEFKIAEARACARSRACCFSEISLDQVDS